MEVGTSNNDPRIVANYYLRAINTINYKVSLITGVEYGMEQWND